MFISDSLNLYQEVLLCSIVNSFKSKHCRGNKLDSDVWQEHKHFQGTQKKFGMTSVNVSLHSANYIKTKLALNLVANSWPFYGDCEIICPVLMCLSINSNIIHKQVLGPFTLVKTKIQKNLGFLLYCLHCQKNP